jgi:hypothetical protein
MMDTDALPAEKGCGMSESITFWLENRNCAGTRVAVIGDQVLVLYRDRYYVVTAGSAQTRGGKPLRFSPSSLPTVWKRALKGDVPAPVAVPETSALASMQTTSAPKRERKKTEKPAMPEAQSQQETAPEKREQASPPVAKVQRKADAPPVVQPPIVAHCPYCSTRHELSLDKGRNGKPFFMPCSKCKAEFAVRIVPVTVYQAQVAGFR